MRALAENGANLNGVKLDTQWFFQRAITHNDLESVKIFLKLKAPFSAKPYHFFHYAAGGNHLEIMKEFLDSGNTGFDQQNQQGDTPLHIAAYLAACRNNEPMIWMLVEKGADLGLQNKEGQTPLDIVKEKGREELAKQLEKNYREQLRSKIESFIPPSDLAQIVTQYVT